MHSNRRIAAALAAGAVAAAPVRAATAGPAGPPVTTILTHGYSIDQSKGAWVEGMADAIIARANAGGVSGGAVCRYDQATGAWAIVSGAFAADAPVVLIYRWLEDFAKDGPDLGFAEAAADALVAALRDPVFSVGGAPTAGVPLVPGRHLHFAGHSRGTIVNSETVERFAVAGLAVDHVTTMDPHPVNGTLDGPFNDFDWGDPVPRTWSNVAFADNVWRADGGGLFNGFDFDGIPIPGALDVELDESALNCCAYTFAHSDTHLWYHGTIDLAPNACDGEQCLDATSRASWYPDGFTEVGFHSARLGGGADRRPTLPPGAAPGPVPTLYGGSFDGASRAGWLYHGGALAGAIVDEGGRTFVKLGAGTGASAVHNHFLLDADAASIVLDHRVLAAGADDVLEVALVARGDRAPGGRAAPRVGRRLDRGHRAADRAGTVRGSAHRLRLRVVSGDGSLVAQAGVDDIRIASAPPCPTDLDGSGGTGFADLSLLLAQWGPCAACAADLDDDGSVGFVDLNELLAAWGACG